MGAPENVAAYLVNERRFEKARPFTAGALAFKGRLPVKAESVEVQLEITDWDFVVYPDIYVLDRPAALAGFRSHLGTGNKLCYLQRGGAVLDRYQPVPVIHRCLEQATKVLQSIAGDKPSDVAVDDFLVHWQADGWALLSAPNAQSKSLGISFLDFPGDRGGVTLLATDLEKRKGELESVGFRSTLAVPNRGLIVPLDGVPMLNPAAWPPKTFAELFEWLDRFSPAARKTILQHLESEELLAGGPVAHVLQCQAGFFGYYFQVVLPLNYDRRFFKRNKGAFKQYILKHRGEIPIVRFVCEDFRPVTIHERNVGPTSSLIGLNIAIVGLGTIGGYLATFLAKLGAGVNGRLSLIDPGQLQVENLGRHVLGMAHLYQNKAEAMCDFIKQQLPHLDVKAFAFDVREIGNLFEHDLVIDATGDEAVSLALNEEHVHRRASQRVPPVLYTWIDGAGVAVRTLLVGDPKQMCYACQWTRDELGNRVERLDVIKALHDGPEHTAGCEGFTVFPVRASVAAAELATEAVLSWQRKEAHATMRIRRLSEHHTRNRKDLSPEPLKNCPACHK